MMMIIIIIIITIITIRVLLILKCCKYNNAEYYSQKSISNLCKSQDRSRRHSFITGKRHAVRKPYLPQAVHLCDRIYLQETSGDVDRRNNSDGRGLDVVYEGEGKCN